MEKHLQLQNITQIASRGKSAWEILENKMLILLLYCQLAIFALSPFFGSIRVAVDIPKSMESFRVRSMFERYI